VFVEDCGLSGRNPPFDCRIRKLTNCGLGQGLAVPRWSFGTTTIASDWVRMLEDDEFADTTFEVEGAHISAHRSVLVVRSEYFRAMLRSGCRETQRGAIIQIGECTPTAFRKLLGFLYSDVLELDDEVVIDVMRKAREYALTRAYNMCMRHCVRGARSSIAISWLLRADECQLDELRAQMLVYVRRHFRAIREEARETLAALRANPDLMLEVMDGLNVI